MAGISSLGVGSNMDLNSLLQRLMSVEQQPLIKLSAKEASAQAKISALGALKGAVSSLQSATTGLMIPDGKTASEFFTSTKTSIADTTIASASGTYAAVAGSYSLEVSKLAKEQRIASKEFTNSTDPILEGAATTGNLKIEIGKVSGGVFTQKSGTTAATITIDSTNNSLVGLRDAINKASTDVSATIVTGTNGPQLMLTSKTTGLENEIRLTSTDGAGTGLAGFVYNPVDEVNGTASFTQNSASGGQEAQDAVYSINGVGGTSSTNSVTTAIEGITITLKKETAALTPTTLTVTKDSSASMAAAISGFVKAYNEAAKTMTDLGKYDSAGKNHGPLLGNAALRNVQSQLRQMVSMSPSEFSGSTYSRMGELGLSFQRDGTLKFDSSKLTKALETDFDNVANLVSTIGTAWNKQLDSKVGTPALVTAATEGLDRTIKDYGKMRTTILARLENIEARYRKQFTTLDQTISQMNQTSGWLQQQLASLPKMSS